MDRITRLMLLSLLAMALSGCGTGPPIRYYTVQIPATADPSTHVYPVALLVGRIEAATVLQDGPIVYRTGVNEIGTYQYRRWVEPPADMLRAKLIRLLRASGDYQSVTELGSASQGEFVVRGTLYDFEEVDSGPSMAALVSMEFSLYNRKTGLNVWSHFYSQSEPVQGNDISAVVAALEHNLDRGLSQVTAGLAEYFSKNPSTKS
ncbi:MAG TPA: ABC-type transport auxiliary lipoprotein family protein [Terriglobia bacterium]